MKNGKVSTVAIIAAILALVITAGAIVAGSIGLSKTINKWMEDITQDTEAPNDTVNIVNPGQIPEEDLSGENGSNPESIYTFHDGNIRLGAWYSKTKSNAVYSIYGEGIEPGTYVIAWRFDRSYQNIGVGYISSADGAYLVGWFDGDTKNPLNPYDGECLTFPNDVNVDELYCNNLEITVGESGEFSLAFLASSEITSAEQAKEILNLLEDYVEYIELRRVV